VLSKFFSKRNLSDAPISRRLCSPLLRFGRHLKFELRQPQGVALLRCLRLAGKFQFQCGGNFMQVSQVNNQSVWKQVYQEALFEIDQTRLRPKLEAALKAVQDRMFEVRSDPTDRRELMELEDAKRTIVFLRKHELQT
jgi:hypothetical protein